MALAWKSHKVFFFKSSKTTSSAILREPSDRGSRLARMEGLIPKEVALASEPRMVVLRGRAGEQISQAAREHEADLIVIGLHGGEPMAVYLGGTVAYRLVCQAPCPVLTVPAAIHE